MSGSVEDADQPAATASGEIPLLCSRVQAVQKMTEMAAERATRLLGHTRHLEATLEQLTQRLELLPDLSQVSLLTQRVESLQALLDWVVTRTTPEGNPADCVEVQTRLSMCRVRLVNLESEIRQAAALTRRLPEARDTLAGLLGDVETLESTKAKAEALMLESEALLAKLESATPGGADLINGS
jgi:chromosome segregation ATPase